MGFSRRIGHDECKEIWKRLKKRPITTTDTPDVGHVLNSRLRTLHLIVGRWAPIHTTIALSENAFERSYLLEEDPESEDPLITCLEVSKAEAELKEDPTLSHRGYWHQDISKRKRFAVSGVGVDDFPRREDMVPRRVERGQRRRLLGAPAST